MRDALVREEHLVQDARKRGQIRNDHPDQIIRFPRHGESLKHLVEPFDQALEAAGIVRGMRGQRDLHESMHMQPHGSRFEGGVIRADRAFSFELLATTRALRSREANLFGQFIVGETAIPLQGGKNAEIKRIHARIVQDLRFFRNI